MATQTQGHVSTLYVGNLHPDVDERLLYELFKEAGTIMSIHVCRHAVTKVSLEYAYVNFQNAADAEKAISQLNYTTIQDRTIRIMWYQRDQTMRKSGVGNIIVKNLSPEIDEKTLHEVFESFGSILSCKISYSKDPETGEMKSNGYGYVHFKEADDAANAVKNMHGKFLNNKELVVEHFVKNAEKKSRSDTFTNVYIKHLPKTMTKQQLEELFSEFGEIQNAVIMTDKNGESLGFGFVNFVKHESAVKAIEEISKRSAGDEEDKDKKFYVARALSKEERAQALQQQQTETRSLQNQDTNLYVKNLSDEIDEEKLKAMFEPFGKVRSVRIMKDPKKKISRGFGFVNFVTAEDASKAIAEMHGHMINDKPLYVALHQPKHVLKAQTNQHRVDQTMMNGHMFPQMVIPFPMHHMGYPPQNMVPWGVDPQIPPTGPITLTEEEKKQQLGNELYGRVHNINQTHAAKITGMFLELDEAEINELLEDPVKLNERVQEALTVLNAAS